MQTQLEKLEADNKLFRAALRKIAALDYEDKEYWNEREMYTDFMYLTPRETSDNLTTAVEVAEKALRVAARLPDMIVIQDQISDMVAE